MRLPHGGAKLPTTGCRMPVLLGLVLMLTVSACCVFGVANGALIGELLGDDLSLGRWLGQRGEERVSTGGAEETPGPGRWLTMLPVSTPVDPPQDAGQSQAEPTHAPAIPMPSPAAVGALATCGAAAWTTTPAGDGIGIAGA